MDKLSYWNRAQDCIAQGALTNSKHPQSHVYGVYPTHITKSNDCYVWDEENRRYTDYICGLGTNLFGYGNSYVKNALYPYMGYGMSPSLPTRYEVELAEALKPMFPWVDRFKFLLSGSEACISALKIARAATGRALVLSDGYHGHNAEFTSLTPPAKGCNTHLIESLIDPETQINGEVAAVIIEPVITDFSVSRGQYLQRLRELCTQHGVILIFDEVVTGFRFKGWSASKYFGVYPDLLVIGKAMANGLPLSAVGGKKEIMDGEYFVSTTFAGHILGHIAGKACVDLLKNNPKYSIDYLWDRGQDFLMRFNSIEPALIRIDGYPTRGVFTACDDMFRVLFFQEACKAGILFCKSWFFNFPLVDETKLVIKYCSDIINRIIRREVSLEGDMPVNPFAQQVREASKR